MKSNIVVTQYLVVSKDSAKVHDKCSLEKNRFTPVVHDNRFWPLIDFNQDEKVVIDEV